VASALSPPAHSISNISECFCVCVCLCSLCVFVRMRTCVYMRVFICAFLERKKKKARMKHRKRQKEREKERKWRNRKRERAREREREREYLLICTRTQKRTSQFLFFQQHWSHLWYFVNSIRKRKRAKWIYITYTHMYIHTRTNITCLQAHLLHTCRKHAKYVHTRVHICIFYIYIYVLSTYTPKNTPNACI